MDVSSTQTEWQLPLSCAARSEGPNQDGFELQFSSVPPGLLMGAGLLLCDRSYLVEGVYL